MIKQTKKLDDVVAADMVLVYVGGYWGVSIFDWCHITKISSASSDPRLG